MTIWQANPRALSLAVLCMSVLPNVWADTEHYNNLLIGDRAAGLGGAYTAVSDDPSGLYYNPAGVVYASEAEVSASGNAYQGVSKTYSNLNDSDFEWNRFSGGMVANYFGVFKPVGPGVAGFSIAIPDYVLENQNDMFDEVRVASDPAKEYTGWHVDHNDEDTTTNMGPSYAIEWSDDLSVGITLYAHMRKKEMIHSEEVYLRDKDTPTNTGFSWTRTHVQTSEFGIRPLLGIMWAPMEKWSVGLTGSFTEILAQTRERKSCGINNATAAKDGENTVITLVAMTDVSIPETSGGSCTFVQQADRTLPVQVTAGVAYFASDSLMVTGDFSFYGATNERESTWNTAVGAEYFLDSVWGLRGGFYTNNANTKEISSTASLREHVDLFGVAFSVSRHAKDSSMTAGVNYALGSGQAVTSPGSNRIQDLSINAFSVFISTSTSL